MLKQLTLKNFVLVESLDIDFHPGLTTITGESGAGKSILLNALGLLLGERANTDVIRPGADRADVTAEFDLSDLPELAQQLEADDLQSEPAGQCLIRRLVSRQGRSKAYINNIPVTTQYLRALGQTLVDVHGQHEHLRLADRSVQLGMLDDYAAQGKRAREVADAYRAWQKIVQDIEQRTRAQEAAKDKQALLSYQVEELHALGLKPGEFEQLEIDQRRLAQAQTTLEVLAGAQERLEELDHLRHAGTRLDQIKDNHSALVSARENLQTALSLLDDAAHDLRNYEDQVVVDPDALSEVDARLSTVLDLARKHRVDGAELADLSERLQADLQDIDAADELLEKLNEQAAKAQAEFFSLAQKLSKARRKAAPKFCKAVTEYMQMLGIKSGVFDIAFSEQESEHGIDRVEYRVTTNPDFPPGSLNQIASGGEQTRIALAIQIVAAAQTQQPCMILDEADVGVGGTTADTVGRILRTLGERCQVICITHAPQVAALGDHHLLVQKDGANTHIQALDVDLRVHELARMLAGADITEKTMDYAATLLNEGQRESA